MADERSMTPEEAAEAGTREATDYPFICPVDFKPHRGSPPGQDPNLDPTFAQTHREDDGAHWQG
jgi:hypothetical protein